MARQVSLVGPVPCQFPRLPARRQGGERRFRNRIGFIAFTAVRGAFGRRPDYLLSGINLGPNTGKVVLHSGTVGAAMTAATHGVRAAAFSLDVSDDATDEQWRSASDVAREILLALRQIPPGVVLNVNIPGAPQPGIHGIRQARLAAAGAVELSIAKAAAGYLHVTVAMARRITPGDPDARRPA